MRRRVASIVCLVAAGLLLCASLALWVDNPTVSVAASDLGDRGPAGEVVCSIAPWDAGLNDNDQGPGGEHSGAFFDEVAADCYSSNTFRFRAGIGLGVAALVLLGGCGIRSRASS